MEQSHGQRKCVIISKNLLVSKAYDIYGLTEISGPVYPLNEEQKGMHIQEDHFIPEIINPDTGEVLPEGEIGELVFTCITKKHIHYSVTAQEIYVI